MNPSTNLMQASREWATRPDDERFATLNEVYMRSFLAAQESTSHDIAQAQLSVTAEDGNLKLVTPVGPMNFSHWSFGQLAQRIGAPAAWLRRLDPELAARNLNAGLEANNGAGLADSQLYYRNAGGTPLLRAITSTSYGRIFNHEVVAAVKNLPGNWVSPLSMLKPGEEGRPATAEDLEYGTNIEIGDPVSLKRALYASDKDMFLFLVDNNRRISDGTDGGLGRGFWVSNSEVGDATFSITRFWYRFVCMNNIVWGAQQVERVSIKHTGRGARVRAFDKLGQELKVYAEASADNDEARIRRAQSFVLGANLEEVQDLVFGDKRLVTKRQVADAYELATIHENVDGNPNTAWGLAQGITRLSQLEKFADDRVAMDKAAGEVLALAA